MLEFGYMLIRREAKRENRRTVGWSCSTNGLMHKLAIFQEPTISMNFGNQTCVPWVQNPDRVRTTLILLYGWHGEDCVGIEMPAILQVGFSHQGEITPLVQWTVFLGPG